MVFCPPFPLIEYLPHTKEKSASFPVIHSQGSCSWCLYAEKIFPQSYLEWIFLIKILELLFLFMFICNWVNDLCYSFSLYFYQELEGFFLLSHNRHGISFTKILRVFVEFAISIPLFLVRVYLIN